MLRLHPLILVLFLGVGMAVGGGGSSAQAQSRLPTHSVGTVPTTDLSADVKEDAWTAVRGERGAKAGGTMGAIGMELALLYFHHQSEGAAGVRALRADARLREKNDGSTAREESGARRERSRLLPPTSADGRFVTVEAIAAEEASQLLGELRRMGMEGGRTTGRLVSGRLPIASLRAASQLSSLRAMMPSYARVQVGSVHSEADTAHSVYEVREQKDVAGDGQKICALSDSYDQDDAAATTADDDVASGDLPGADNPEGRTTPVDVREDADGTDEGRAMLQLIHDLAPEADLGFHTAAGGVATFAEAVRELGDPAEGDCSVIVDDIGYNIEPFYQDGPVSNAVNEVVNDDGAVYFSSAGNDGRNSYEAPFRNSGQSGVINESSELHDFDSTSTVDTRQSIGIAAGGTFRIFTMQWTDPSSLVEGSAGADTDLDVGLVDEEGTVVAESSSDNLASGIPVEGVLEYTNETGSEQTLELVIEKAIGPDPDEVKYIYSGSGYSVEEYDTLGPTIYGHPMAEGAMAVAAAPFYNTQAYNSDADPAALEPFSSLGGIDILFDQSGNRLLTPESREKPDVTGTDGIDNTFFGSDIDDSFFEGVDADSHPNFFGTSAAAPNVAAIGALIQQARPGFVPADVYDRLESAALDVTTRQNRNGSFVLIASGFDSWSGHGFVPALDAVPERDVFDLQLAEGNVETGDYTLSWQERSGADVQDYVIERRYFDGPFEPVDGDVTSDGDTRSVDVGALGLGAFTFRVEWVRSDGVEGHRTFVDTLDFQGVRADLQSADEKARRGVALSWNVPAGTNGFTYHVERKRGDGGAFEPLASTSDTRYTAERQVPGQYSYRITARDGQGHSLTSPAQEVNVDFEGEVVAIGPYPNPVHSTATLDVTARETQTVTVEVFNAIGERLFRDQRDLSARTATALTVDARRWSSGVYFVRLRGRAFTTTQKFVVVK